MRINLRVARVRNQFTQLELAQKVGVSQQTVAKWERGVTAPSHLATIKILECILGESGKYLFPDVFDT